MVIKSMDSEIKTAWSVTNYIHSLDRVTEPLQASSGKLAS